MATSTCGKCEGRSFEIAEVSPSGSRFKYYFVQCTKCGVPVGVLDFDNTGVGITGLENQLKTIQQENATLRSELAAIRQKVDKIR